MNTSARKQKGKSPTIDSLVALKCTESLVVGLIRTWLDSSAGLCGRLQSFATLATLLRGSVGLNLVCISVAEVLCNSSRLEQMTTTRTRRMTILNHAKCVGVLVKYATTIGCIESDFQTYQFLLCLSFAVVSTAWQQRMTSHVSLTTSSAKQDFPSQISPRVDDLNSF